MIGVSAVNKTFSQPHGSNTVNMCIRSVVSHFVLKIETAYFPRMTVYMFHTLFNIVCSIGYIVVNGKMIMNDELGKKLKDEELSHYSFGESERGHENPVKMANLWAKIQAQGLQNTNQEHYTLHYTTASGERSCLNTNVC